MKTIAILGALCLTGIALAGCDSRDPREKAVRNAYAEIDRAMETKDVAKVTSYWATDGIAVRHEKTSSLWEREASTREFLRRILNIEQKSIISSFKLEGKGAVVDVVTKMTADRSGPLDSTITYRDYWEPVDGVWKLKRSRYVHAKIFWNGMPMPIPP